MKVNAVGHADRTLHGERQEDRNAVEGQEGTGQVDRNTGEDTNRRTGTQEYRCRYTQKDS